MSALLYSGGLDAYCIRQLMDPETLVFCDPGTSEASQELLLVDDTVDEFEYVNLSFLQKFERDDKVIPLRNTFFAMAGALFDDEVLFGATRGDGVDTNDTTRAWASATEAALNSYANPEREYEVRLPYKQYTKAELVKEVISETDTTYFDILEESKSCHYGTVECGCGECFGCLRRYVALAANNMAIDVLLDYFDEDPVESVFKERKEEVATNFYRRGFEYEDYLVALENTPHAEPVSAPEEVWDDE